LVVESRHADFMSGDRVQGEFGWREHAVLDGQGLRKLPQDLRPLSLSLGVVGIAGGPAKCQHVVAELGFDDCIDYKRARSDRRLPRRHRRVSISISTTSAAISWTPFYPASILMHA